MSYTLKYFNARGVVENVRVMFALAKVSYTDFRYPLDYPSFNCPEFKEAKANGELYMNMDRLPIMEYNGVQFGQSKTIERFVARKLGFAGSNDAEEVLIDMLCEHVRDIKQKYNDAKAGKTGDAMNEAKASFVAKDLPEWLEKLEKCVQAGGFAVGDKISIADISIHQLIRDHFDDADAALRACSGCPKLTAIVENISTAAKEWFSSRPVTGI